MTAVSTKALQGRIRVQSNRSTATSVEAAVREVYVAEYGRLAGWTNKLVAVFPTPAGRGPG